MADYDNSLRSRNYPPNHLKGDGNGAGLFWALFAIAVLGGLVLFGAFGGGATPVDHPGGAGAGAVSVPLEPQAVPTEGTSVVD